jgi:hypothetical protein
MSVVSAIIDLVRNKTLLTRKEITMARAISVKIPTGKVIEMIEQKIVEIDNDIATYPARKAQYKLDLEAYTQSVVRLLTDLLNTRGTELLSNEDHNQNIRVSTNYNNSVEITIGRELTADLVKPTEPTDPEPKGYYGRVYGSKKSELEKTLKLLRMSEQETITSSAYNSVLELL